MLNEIRITADYRESPSGIPDLLLKEDVEIILKNMKAGDYLINNHLLVERKTCEDFIQSLINNRLFGQCLKLKQNSEYQLFIVEGNPYKTKHKIKKEAIKGALLSISVAWQIPMFLTNNKEETIKLLLMCGQQILQEKITVLRKGYKPKKLKNKQLYFLQGLPEIGPLLALRLLKHFKKIENISKASVKDFRKIEGIGKTKANKIKDFFSLKF